MDAAEEAPADGFGIPEYLSASLDVSSIPIPPSLSLPQGLNW